MNMKLLDVVVKLKYGTIATPDTPGGGNEETAVLGKAQLGIMKLGAR
jgi:hypothetical protein